MIDLISFYIMYLLCKRYTFLYGISSTDRHTVLLCSGRSTLSYRSATLTIWNFIFVPIKGTYRVYLIMGSTLHVHKSSVWLEKRISYRENMLKFYSNANKNKNKVY